MHNKKKQQGVIKQEWWSIFFMLFTIVLCWRFVDDIDDFIVEKLTNIGINPVSFYKVLGDACIINFLLTVGIVAGLIQLIVHNYSDRCFSFFRVTIAVCVIILLYLQDRWVFAATIVPFVKYNELISLGALLYLLAPLLRYIIDYLSSKHDEVPRRKILSLYSDNEEEVGISESRTKYANQLADRLLKTNVIKEAYAVGIAAEWGSGKTLFLDAVEKAIGNKAIIVKFNPWNSKDESHLAKDFLKTLSQHLSPLYSGISSPIRKYASLLYSLRIHVASDYILQYLPKYEEKDLAQRKKDIEVALDKIGKPVVVFVDDIDRLEGKEIFEVLRIIRNTAVFRHVMYVVAYDKAHVLSQLSQLRIGDEADYLEKIFQMEVLLPKPDEKMLVSEFKTVCRAMSLSTSPINSVLDKLTEEDYHQMTKVLTSYRKVKRFARQFSFNASYLMKNFTDREFELQDVLFLCLLEYTNSELYKSVWQKPEELFAIKNHPDNNVRYYSWPKLVGNETSNTQENLGSTCEYIMKRLFGNVPDIKTHSIQFVDLFYKYFYLAQPEKELSKKEFNAMLSMPISPSAHNGMRATISSWVASKDNKSCSSLYRAFVNYNTLNNDNYQQCANYLHAVFYWLEYEDREYAHLKELLPIILNKSRYRGNMKENIRQLANDKVKCLAEKRKYHTASIVLSELYRRLDAGEKLLLDISTVESALHRNTEQFLKSKPWDPVLLFHNDDNMMRKVIEACCVPLQSKSNKKENLVISQVIEYYSEHKSNSYKEANQLLQMVPQIKVYGPQSSSDKSLDDLTRIFGDDLEIAIKLLKSCFNGVV